MDKEKPKVDIKLISVIGLLAIAAGAVVFASAMASQMVDKVVDAVIGIPGKE